MTISRQPSQPCGICGKDIDLRNDKIDQSGRPVHNNCYATQRTSGRIVQSSVTPLTAASATGGNVSTRAVHYHIRWSGNDTLDWDCFDTRSAAEERARELVRSNENYTIEEQDETCPRCANISGTSIPS